MKKMVIKLKVLWISLLSISDKVVFEVLIKYLDLFPFRIK